MPQTAAKELEDPVKKDVVDDLVDEMIDDVEPTKEEKEIRSRKERPTGSIHFGDTDFDVVDEYGDATWSEVCRSCCCHTPIEWAWIFVGTCIVVFFLYWFLFGLELLGVGAKVMTGTLFLRFLLPPSCAFRFRSARSGTFAHS